MNCRSLAKTLFALAFAAGFAAAHSQARIPVPSRWQGQANVAIAGKVYRMPVTLDLSAAGNAEQNPLRLFLAIGNQAQPGSCLVTSAGEMTTPYSLQQYTVRYMNVRYTGSRIDAALANTQSDLAAALNSFTAPNISAAYAPDNLKGMYSTMPLVSELFYFQTGMSMAVQLQNGYLVGSIRGVGRSYTAIFSTPNVEYAAGFSLARIQ